MIRLTLDRFAPIVRLAVIATVALMLPARGAVAQGTSGMLPDPITSADFTGYADMLQLSPQQRATVASMHSAYKLEFRGLREGEIRDFMESMRSLQGNGMLPSREAFDDFMSRLESIRGRISQLDRRLFDTMVVVLTEDQLAALPRVRKTRERERYMASILNASFFGGSLPVDLSRAILDLQLEDDELEQLTDEMVRYENRLTSIMGKLETATGSTLKRFFDALDEQGLAETDPNDEETQMAVMQTMQTVMAEIARDALKLGDEARELNRAALRRFRELVDGATAVRVHNAIIDTYSTVAHSHRWDDTALRQAAQSSSLDEATRSQAATLLEQCQAEMFRLGDAAVLANDEAMTMANPMFGNVDWEARQKTIAEINATGTNAQARFQAALVDLVGEAMVATLEGEARAGRTANSANADVTATEHVHTLPTAHDAWTNDQFMQRPIGKADLRRYATVLGFDETDKTILDALHDEHVRHYEVIRDGDLRQLSEAQANLWTANEDGSIDPPSTDQFEAIDALRGRVRAAVEAADTAFFDEVETVLLDTDESPAMKRVRRMRERELYGRSVQTGSPGGNDGAAAIDLTSLVVRTPVDAAVREQLTLALADYFEQSHELFERRFKASIDLAGAVQRWSAEIQREQADGNYDPAAMQKHAARWIEGPQARLKQVNDEIKDLNEATLVALRATVSTDAGLALRQTYRHAAFPSVYADPTAVERHLAAARGLRDLDGSLRGRLDDLAAEYLPAYEKHCERLIELHRDVQMPWMSTEQVDWSEFQRRQDEIAQINFDRNELNSHAILQLQALLTSEQIKQIGGLPDLALGASGNWWD